VDENISTFCLKNMQGSACPSLPSPPVLSPSPSRKGYGKGGGEGRRERGGRVWTSKLSNLGCNASAESNPSY